jgi:NitT/TauT family transport system ATP-binding protein
MFVTHDIEEAVFLADRVIVLGGAPAAIIEETTVPIARDERRGSEQLYRFSARIAHTLEHG